MPSRGSGGGHDSDNETEKMPYCRHPRQCIVNAPHSRQEGEMSMGGIQHRVSPVGISGTLTRRGLVRAAAGVAAAAAMPRRIWAASDEISPVMAKLSNIYERSR
jgi:hypothetical protein